MFCACAYTYVCVCVCACACIATISFAAVIKLGLTLMPGSDLGCKADYPGCDCSSSQCCTYR
jgi:hypothetical protein